jgi:lysine 2,3-aminomutase
MASTTKRKLNQNMFIPAKVKPDRLSNNNSSFSTDYSKSDFLRECSLLLDAVKDCKTTEEAREHLVDLVMSLRISNSMQEGGRWNRALDRMRDCTRAILGILSASSDEKARFSVTQAIWDLSRGVDRPDLEAGFFAEIIHFAWGIEGRTIDNSLESPPLVDNGLSGREAAIQRSNELDKLFAHVEDWMSRYEHGLSEGSRARRRKRRFEILEHLSGTPDDWKNWKWQVSKVGRDIQSLDGLVELSEEERRNISNACDHSIPFGVTPYYLSLMDNRDAHSRDRAIRAQVFPPKKYVTEMVEKHSRREEAFDFMQEQETSPIDLITRRYPGIVILKPFNTCPQICVYCCVFRTNVITDIVLS